MGTCVGSVSILPIIKLAAALRFFAEGSYQEGAGNDLFVGMAQPTFSKALSEVLMILENKLCPTAIIFAIDDDEQDLVTTKRDFRGLLVAGQNYFQVRPAVWLHCLTQLQRC